jgi:hypothetical protein
MRYQVLQQSRRAWLIPREQSVLTGFLFLVLLFIPVTGSTVEFWHKIRLQHVETRAQGFGE